MIIVRRLVSGSRTTPMEILSLFQHEQHRRGMQKQDPKTFQPQSCPTRSLKGTHAMHGPTPKHTQPTYRVFNLISTQAWKLSPPTFFPAVVKPDSHLRHWLQMARKWPGPKLSGSPPEPCLVALWSSCVHASSYDPSSGRYQV